MRSLCLFKRVASFCAQEVSVISLLDRTPAFLEKASVIPKSYCFGTIETETTVGSCILLQDGRVLVSLHVIFDLHGHKKLEKDPKMDIQGLYAPLNSITLSFIKNEQAYTCSVAGIVKDGRAHLYHDRVDSNFGWDFALLQPAADLVACLGPGVALESTDYTYGRGLLLDNPKNTVFVSRPQINWANFEFVQFAQRANPAQPPSGPLSLYGDDPTLKLPSFSGGAVLSPQGNVYQIKHHRAYSLYTSSILDFMSRDVEDTRLLPYYYKFGISAVEFIGKKGSKREIAASKAAEAEANRVTVDKSIRGSLPFDKFKGAVNEASEYTWVNTQPEGTVKVWEIIKTERWDFHLSACTDPTAQHVVKFHFTLRDSANGDKSRSALAWFSLKGHGVEATLGEREDASEAELFSDPELDEETQAHVAQIEAYAARIFELALEYTAK